MEFFERDANIKFCESKNLYYPFYEFCNSISNIIYIIIAFRIFKYKKKSTNIIGSTAFMVGVGSFLLHATGKLWAQYLDELFMVVLINNIYEGLCPKHTGSYISASHIILGSYFYWGNHNLFLLCFSMGIALNFFVLYKLSKIDSYIKFNTINTTLIFLAGSFCWFYEQNRCVEGSYYSLLHSLWHILSASALIPLCNIINFLN